MSGLLFELRYRKEAYFKSLSGTDRGKLVRDSSRDADLPDSPPQFRTMRGSYTTISDEACRLNDVQTRSGFLHYLFFPEVVQTDGAR